MGVEREMASIRDRWFHVFGSMVLSHDMNRLENCGHVIDHLIEL